MKSMCLTLDQIKKKISKKTKAILYVAVYGNADELDLIENYCKKKKLFLIVDAAAALGSKFKSRSAGTFGKASAISLYPAKILGCFGDGGAVFTNDETLHKKMTSIRLHGQIKRYEHSFIGLGARMDTLQAAILNVKIDYYNNDIKNRQRVAKKYTELLKNHIQVPIINPNKKSVWAQYSIQIKNRNLVQKKLKKNI